MKAISLILLFLCCISQAAAQNLVRNPSLEELKNGVVGFRGVSGTPDIASKDNKVNQYLPYYNLYQSKLEERSLSGIEFGDVCICQWFSATTSELTQAELLRPLRRNREYIVSLYTIRTSMNESAIKEVSVYFSRKPLPATRELYGYKPHSLTEQEIPYLSLTSSASPIIDSRETWTKVEAVYRAKGGERYLTIGNFIGANKAELETLKPKGRDGAKHLKHRGTYYCYDNISVVLKPRPRPKLIDRVAAALQQKPFSTPFGIGDTITLQDVTFATGKYQILDAAFPTLDSLAVFLNEEPDAVLHIDGHTDDVGTEEDNLKLSVQRAQAVHQYLMSKGIATERMTFKGHGETLPKVENETDEHRALNRRVEIQIRRR